MIYVSELDNNIKKLVQYGINSGLIPESERNYSTNMILDAFGKDDYSDPDISDEEINLDNILDNLLDIACEMKLIEDSITYSYPFVFLFAIRKSRRSKDDLNLNQ